MTLEEEDQVRRALGEGNRTFRIAARCDMTTARARSILNRLERDGIVYKDSYLSAPNDTYWRPRGAPITADRATAEKALEWQADSDG